MRVLHTSFDQGGMLAQVKLMHKHVVLASTFNPIMFGDASLLYGEARVVGQVITAPDGEHKAHVFVVAKAQLVDMADSLHLEVQRARPLKFVDISFKPETL